MTLIASDCLWVPMIADCLWCPMTFLWLSFDFFKCNSLFPLPVCMIFLNFPRFSWFFRILLFSSNVYTKEVNPVNCRQKCVHRSLPIWHDFLWFPQYFYWTLSIVSYDCLWYPTILLRFCMIHFCFPKCNNLFSLRIYYFLHVHAHFN